MTPPPTTLPDDIHTLVRQSGLQGRALKDALRAAVAKSWPDLPPWTTLQSPVIEEVQKAGVGSGVAVVFNDDGVWKTLVGLAGDHYKPRDAATMPTAYMIPGGFINLSRTPGSSQVPPAAQPEDGRTGAAREVEEEFRLPDGSPLLSIDPARLSPVDTKTLLLPGDQCRVVMGFMLVLTADEVKTAKLHIELCAARPAYAAAAAAQSINHDTGKPEVAALSIFRLDDVAAGKVPLLHQDQQSLFELTRQRLGPPPAPPRTPSNARAALD